MQVFGKPVSRIRSLLAEQIDVGTSYSSLYDTQVLGDSHVFVDRDLWRRDVAAFTAVKGSAMAQYNQKCLETIGRCVKSEKLMLRNRLKAV